MSQLHFNVWPRTLPHHLPIPDTSLWYNLEVSAARFPNKPAVVFYDSVLTYAELARSAERLAGFLQHHCGVQRGDRVALFLHNSPQFVIAYYAILRADAMVVPVNSMSRTAELTHIVEDCGARVLVAEQSLLVHAQPLLGRQIQDAIVATYSEYLTQTTDLTLPEVVAAPRRRINDQRVTPWSTALATGLLPRMHLATSEDLCVMPYTSGTTGKPKGCVHRHRNAMHTAAALARWYEKHQDDCVLSV
ncbi:MAG: AMP-binding protein, partial [Gammaproteobacteria bacterium]